MKLSDLVRRARSVRRFQESERIPLQVLREWIDTVRLVPSAANRQPLRYKLLHTVEDCATMFPFTAWAGYLTDWEGPVAGERPAAYALLLCAADKAKPDTDAGIAGQTLQLLAAEAGYGACMLGALHREEIHRAFALPEDQTVLLAIAFGRPAETVILDEVAAGAEGLDSIKYWRDEQGVHHVLKRPLADVLI